jgi:hypothetical protein
LGLILLRQADKEKQVDQTDGGKQRKITNQEEKFTIGSAKEERQEKIHT